jgi:Ca-activated chloride channel family protein
MSLGAPTALLVLLAVPAVLVPAVLVARRRRPRATAFTNLAVLEAVARSARRPRGRLVPAALLVLALAAAATAAARPQARLPVRVDNATIVLLVDVSGSMSARDVEPTRLDAAVAAMRGFVQRLPPGFKVGLVQFSDQPEVLASPTADHTRISENLGLLVPDSGTALGAGLATAVQLTRAALRRDGIAAVPGKRLPAAIILLSDGKQNQGRIQPLQAATLARSAGIPVDTVALGTRHGILGFGPFAPRVAPAPELMRRIAKETGGATATAKDTRELTTFYRRVGSSVGHATRTRDVGAWFATAAAVLLASAAALSRLFSGALSL